MAKKEKKTTLVLEGLYFHLFTYTILIKLFLVIKVDCFNLFPLYLDLLVIFYTVEYFFVSFLD